MRTRLLGKGRCCNLEGIQGEGPQGRVDGVGVGEGLREGGTEAERGAAMGGERV